MSAARAAGVQRTLQPVGPVMARIAPCKLTPRAMNDVGLQAPAPAVVARLGGSYVGSRPQERVGALALGAQAVLVGRATLYGAVAVGGPGAQRTLVILRNEIGRDMRLCGVTRVADIDGGLFAS